MRFPVPSPSRDAALLAAVLIPVTLLVVAVPGGAQAAMPDAATPSDVVHATTAMAAETLPRLTAIIQVETGALLPDEGAVGTTPVAPGLVVYAAPSDRAAYARLDLDAGDTRLPAETTAPLASSYGGAKSMGRGLNLKAASTPHVDHNPTEAAWTPSSPADPRSTVRSLPFPAPSHAGRGASEEARSASADRAPIPVAPRIGGRDEPTTHAALTRAGPDVATVIAHAAITSAILAILGLVPWALYHRVSGHSLLTHKVRKTIHEAVTETPGIGVRDLAGSTGVTYSTVTYHLARLVDAGILVETESRGTLRYHVSGGITHRARGLMPVAENPEALRVLEVIRSTPGIHRAVLARILGVSASTVNWHLRRLLATDLVTETRDGRRACLQPDEDVITRDLEPLLAPKVRRPAFSSGDATA